jgi:hypothetical protein
MMGSLAIILGDSTSGLSLVHPEGPLNIRDPVARHLYKVSPIFCERLAALTDTRIQEIAANWYQLQHPLLAADQLPRLSEGKSEHRKKVLHSLADLARSAIREGQVLLIYVEHRREER